MPTIAEIARQLPDVPEITARTLLWELSRPDLLRVARYHNIRVSGDVSAIVEQIIQATVYATVVQRQLGEDFQ